MKTLQFWSILTYLWDVIFQKGCIKLIKNCRSFDQRYICKSVSFYFGSVSRVSLLLNFILFVFPENSRLILIANTMAAHQQQQQQLQQTQNSAILVNKFYFKIMKIFPLTLLLPFHSFSIAYHNCSKLKML